MNASLMQSWASITQKFEALNQRERWLVFGALLVVVYAIINMLFLESVISQKKLLTNEIASNQTQISTLKQQLDQYAGLSINDPDAQNKQRIKTLQVSLNSLEHEINNLQTTLINPDKMPALLRSLLKKNSHLKLVELKTLPTTGLLDEASSNDPITAVVTSEQANINAVKTTSEAYIAPVFKHGVEITLEGPYLDLLAYVSELEKMPWHVLWSKASLNTEQPNQTQWPTNRLKLTVYTLSLDQAWLSI